MPKKAPLRAVTADEKPDEAPEVPKTILEAAEAGERLSELRAMRRRLARSLDDPNTPARDLAALSRRQLEIGREIEAIAIAEVEESSIVEPLEVESWNATGY